MPKLFGNIFRYLTPAIRADFNMLCTALLIGRCLRIQPVNLMAACYFESLKRSVRHVVVYDLDLSGATVGLSQTIPGYDGGISNILRTRLASASISNGFVIISMPEERKLLLAAFSA